MLSTPLDSMSCYLQKIPQLALAPGDYNLTEFRLNLFRIVCSHEHYITLNLPLSPSLDPPSSTGSTFKDDNASYIESMSTLTKEYLQQHYLTGLVLSELARVLNGRYSASLHVIPVSTHDYRMAKLRELAVALIHDLFASHDANPRYQSQSSRKYIAMLYMPLLSIVMDNIANLYHGSERKDDWASSLGKLVKVLDMVTIFQITHLMNIKLTVFMKQKFEVLIIVYKLMQ